VTTTAREAPRTAGAVPRSETAVGAAPGVRGRVRVRVRVRARVRVRVRVRVRDH
jgi:hypothetical protein